MLLQNLDESKLKNNVKNENALLSDNQQNLSKLSSKIMKRLIVGAQAENAQLITTEKDYVRLPKEFRSEVMTLPVRILSLIHI